MSIRHVCLFLFISTLLAITVWTPSNSQVAGRNVNMVAGRKLPGGDPWLQRQNEPSIAVSTRNALHLLAGANDYRTVEVPIPGEDLPGLPAGVVAGDAWLGVFKSYNGGQSWISTLLPGYPQDRSNEGLESPLFGFQTASDPTVRAGDNGLFFYSGIAFNRGKNGRGVIFVARYIDNNNRENGDPIEYIDTKVIDEGTSGQFADKPWIAVDTPRAVGTVLVNDQSIPRFNVYIVYSLFVGDLEQNVHNKILFARSTDGGNTWEKPIKLSETQHINQGTTLAIGPDGTIYVAWRRYASGDVPHAIIFTKSTDFGQRFTKPAEVDTIDPFDQGTTGTSFRTSSFPTIAVDDGGRVYLAWAERNKGVSSSGGDARIVITASTNGGKKWTLPAKPIDDYPGRGHQIMPSLTFGSGKLMMAWYDFRNDYSGQFAYYISDPLLGKRHTVDVRLAQADPVQNPGQYPFFYESIQVSRYLWTWHQGNFCQAQYNPPNYPLFKQGTVPFHGDYIDIAASPESIFHVVWTDNRDVRPPFDNDWTYYNPPNADPNFPHDFYFPEEPCEELEGKRTGMRNQNVYTSRIIPGIEIGSLGNTKPLINTLGGIIQRAYVINVKNTTDYKKHVRLKITNQPPGGEASFFQFEVPQGFDPDQLDVSIAPHSSISRPVFVTSSDFYASVRIEVLEIDDIGSPGGSHIGYIDLNSDPTNPEIENPPEWEGEDIRDYENHNINIEHTSIVNLTNVNLVNPDINIEHVNLTNPNLNHINIEHINIEHVNLTNPNLYIPDPDINIEHVNLTNVNIVHTTIKEEYDPNVLTNITDIRWSVRNDGNTASSYTFRAVAPEELPTGLYAQLLIYRMHYTPKSDYTTADGCTLKYEPHHELLVNVVDPVINIEHINIEHPNLEIAAIENATFALPPGEEAYIILRIIEPVTGGSPLKTPSTGESFANTVGAGFTAHAANTTQTVPPVATTPPQILTLSLADGVIGQSYSETLEAFGGKEPYEWSISEGTLPNGLDINPNTGEIFGLPTVEGNFEFTVEVNDSTLPEPQSATQVLAIRISKPLIIPSTLLPDGVMDSEYSTTLVASGGLPPFTWSLAEGSNPLPYNLTLSSGGEINGTPENSGEFQFTVDVIDSSFPTQSETQTLDIRIFEPLVITTTSLDDGVTGSHYSETLEAAGGLPELIWSLKSGDLPTGLSLNSSGVISGMPEIAGVFNFTVEVSDSSDPMQSTNKTLSIRIADLLEIITELLPEGVKGTNYSLELHAKGGLLPLSWSLISGTLPPELTLSSGGVISGTPENSGEFVFTVDVIDSSSPPQTDTQTLTIRIAEPLEITTTSLPDGVRGRPYTKTMLKATGGLTPYKWSISNGVLPDGLELDPDTGEIDGTPTVVGSFPFTVEVEDSSDPKQADTQILIILILDTLDIKTTSLSSGSVDSPYDESLEATGGLGPYKWSISDGVLPDGLELDPDTGGISGTPTYDPNVTYPHTYSFTIKVKDYFVPPQEDTQVLGIEIFPKKEDWVARYEGSGDDEATAIAVDSSGNVYVTGYSIGLTTGADYYTIKYNSDGNFQWNVRYDGPVHGDDKATAITVDSSGVYVSGSSEGIDSGPDYFTVKYDASSGNVLWEARFDGPAHMGDYPTANAVDSLGNVYVTGYSYRGMQWKHSDYLTVKYDSAGNLVWDVRYDSRRNGNDEASAIAFDLEGNVCVTGRSQESSGSDKEKDYDYYTVKYDKADGKTLWEARYDGPTNGDDEATAIAVDTEGYLYVTGFCAGEATGKDYCTVKYGSSRNPIWVAKHDGIGDDEATAIAVYSLGIYVTGKSLGSGTAEDFVTVKYKASDGSKIWDKRYDGPLHGTDVATAIVVDALGNAYVTGYSTGSSADFFTIKYDGSGNIIWEARYDGPASLDDRANAIAIDLNSGNVYVTGYSTGNGTSKDFATVKY